MKTADHPTAKSLFLDAVANVAPTDWAAFLDKHCNGDADVRRQVEALLKAHAAPDSLLDAEGPEATHEWRQITEKPGALIGPYQLREQIGEGGFGVVYLAEQTEPVKRRVALKIIKPGMDTKEVISRFEAERQALALMDHPGIARVLDAGATESGRPYFVMELVKGISITDYCDQCHLATDDRLQLFLQVCQAIQHAHQKGVIHRDIKPSNVLIAMQDGKPVPKVIDFGVAKAINQRLTEHTLLTRFAQVVGTPLYMSPEQAEMSPLDVDTRSDIYSLGVLLYELLTGTTPFERERLKEATFDEMRRIIREEEPLRPSARISTLGADVTTVAEKRRTEPRKLQQVVRGDLDWIAMKALEKDRTRRYETASSLAEDVERYLNDEPVQACPPSAGYRFRKFARRNRLALFTTSGIAVAVVALAVGASVAAVQFEDLADRNARLADDLGNALADAEGNLELANSETERAESALALVTTEQQRAEGNLDLALEALDAVYLDAIGTEKLLGDPISRPEPGDPDFSPSARPPLSDLEKELLRRGLSFYDQFASQNANTRRAALQTAQAHHRVGLLQAALGDHVSAASAYQAAVERFEQLTRDAPDNAGYHRQLAEAYHGLGGSLPGWPAARQAFENEQRTWSRVIELEPNDSDLYLKRASLSEFLGDARQRREDLETSLQLAPDDPKVLRECSAFYQGVDRQKSLELAERAVTLAPDDPYCHLRLANFFAVADRITYQGPFGHGQPLHNVVDQDLALEHFNRAVDLAPDTATMFANRGVFFRNIGDYDRALEDLTRALELNPQSGFLFNQRARLHRALGSLDDASSDVAAALRIDPHNFGWRGTAAEIFLEQQDWQRAFDEADIAIAMRPEIWSTYKRRAVALFQLGRFEESLADLETAVRLAPKDLSTLIWICSWANLAECPDDDFKHGLIELASEAIERPDVNRAVAHRYRGELYRALRQWEEAVSDYSRAIELRLDALQTVIAWGHRSQAHFRLGQYEEARTDLEKTIELRGDDGPNLDLGPRWWFYAMTLWHVGETERAGELLNELEQLFADLPPERRATQERVRAEALELIDVNSPEK